MSLPNPFMTQNSNLTQNKQHAVQQIPPSLFQNFDRPNNSYQGSSDNRQRGRLNNNSHAAIRIRNRHKRDRQFQDKPQFQGPLPSPNTDINFRQQHQRSTIPKNFHSCPYCKVEFADQFELYAHRKSHQKCPYDECVFNANELTIAEHIQKVHIKTKIKDLTSPEDIEKWREERRKRYPTSANVAIRQKIQEMKQNRGEKLHDSKSRFGDNQQKDFIEKGLDDWDKRQKEKKERKKQQKEEMKKAKKKARRLVKRMCVEPKNVDEEKEKLKFKGTGELKDYKKEENNSSLSLLNAYGSDSESDNMIKADESIESLETVKNEVEEPVKQIELENDEEDLEINDDDPPEEVTNPTEDNQPHAETSTRKRKHPETSSSKPKRAKSAIDYSKLRNIKSTNPFLEKLLHREIVHERNYLLQCVSYVVKNNFFEVGQESSDTKCDENP